MGVIIFNGVSTEEHNIVVEIRPDYETPEKDYEIIHVPGKNGDVIIDKNSYQNVSRKYHVARGSTDGDFTQLAHSISEWLQGASGYARLEDSYEPEYYRMAAYNEASTLYNIHNHAARAEITFNCKPQRYLKSGEEPIIFEGAGEIFNPTKFKAKPVILARGNGNGVITIGNYTVTISSLSENVTINSEIGDAYSGSVNKNSTVILNPDFPLLIPGENEITFYGGIQSLVITPNWWTL